MIQEPIDVNPEETQDWLEALHAVLKYEGSARVRYLIRQLTERSRQLGVQIPLKTTTDYVNTILPDQEAKHPGDLAIEKSIEALIRWNAIVMVLRATRDAPELGGHIASYASAAVLYETGFNHFFRAQTASHLGDFIFFQGHSSPGIYARAFLEGRLTESQLGKFRQEVETDGLSSYPHPWLMKDFWQQATVSMGLGPLMAIYQARFMKYLENRQLIPDQNRKVWAFCGDGEMDEPESIGAITLAAREKLNNLIFVINCNLQRLDGPVRGNGKVIQEFEGLFQGAGWKVIKVVWGQAWDKLFARDQKGLLRQRMMDLLDGDYQNYEANGNFHEHFFGESPELAAMVSDFSNDEIRALNRGGHDAVKVYAAYAEAVKSSDQPIVILAKTVKGYGMGDAGEAQNTTHQQKKMTVEQLRCFRDRFDLPVTDDAIRELSFYKPAEDSPEITYLKKHREALGGSVPSRRIASESLDVGPLSQFKALLQGSGDREMSSTMAFIRFLGLLIKHQTLGQRVVPIVPDECRSFGMEGMFRQLGIYSAVGQLYQPADAAQLMYYREDQKGQIIQEGLSEAGGMASWISAGTSHSNHNYPMIPFFIYYSMFGFQRIGDFAWAAGDMKAKGFMMGGTAGRTTLAGEGLQHQDGHSHLLASTIPNCISYDPCFAYELAVILHDGLRRMYQEQEDVFYYITIMNENYTHPTLPTGIEEDLIKGMYRFQSMPKKSDKTHVQLLGSGTILREVIAAARILEKDYAVTSDIWSVTSFNELAREALKVDRQNRLHPDKMKRSHVRQCFDGQTGPIIAATDYMKVYADQIRREVLAPYHVLGTDGFGRSDTRAQLRHFFEIDAKSIVYCALFALHEVGCFSKTKLKSAMKKLGIEVNKPDPAVN